MNLKTLIFLETANQVQAYFKHRSQYKQPTLITLSFEAEEELLKNKIKYISSDDYETKAIYKDIDKKSLEIANIITSSIKNEHKGIKLSELLLYDLTYFSSYVLTRISIISEVIKKEKPSEIIVIDTDNNQNSILVSGKDTLHSFIIPNIFNKTKIIKSPSINSKKTSLKNKIAMSLAEKTQNFIGKLDLFLSNTKNISIVGTKNNFEPIISNSTNLKFVRIKDSPGKSFFINKNYIPFINLSPKSIEKSIAIDPNTSETIKNLTFRGIPLSPILSERIFLVYSKFPYLISLIDSLERFMINNRIKANFLMSDVNTFEKVVALVSKNLNIPSIVVQHGITGHRIGFSPLSADYFCAWGEESKKWLINLGVNKNKIITTGCPRYDSLINKNKENTEKNKENKIKKILYIPQVTNRTTYFPNYHITLKQRKKIFEMLFKALKKKSDYHLTISIRPGDELGRLADMIANELNFKNYSKFTGEDIIPEIINSDIILTQFSSVGVEALLLGKPLITIKEKGEKELVPFSSLNSSYSISNEKELLRSLGKKPLKPNKFLKRYLSNMGSATENVLKLLKGVIIS